jgi:hypothetical protein
MRLPPRLEARPPSKSGVRMAAGLPLFYLVNSMITKPHRLAVGMLSAWFLGLALCGCATRGAEPHAAPVLGHPTLATRENTFWWACRFKLVWPPGQDADPDLTADLLLAHAVVQPVLRAYESRITCWRFHRRANRDTAGHQFSFLFYADPETAREIFQKIGESKPLSEALAANMVEKVMVDDPAKPTRPGVGDTSDPHWSPMLQRTWPSFIMGVSCLWLGLIDESMAEVPGGSDEIHDLLERYRKADARITAIWYQEGQHALLHHLNAIFGYGPMLIKKAISF